MSYFWRISVKYDKGKTRPTANFDASELEAFRDDLNQPTVKPAVESRQTPTEVQQQTDKQCFTRREITERSDISVIDKLASIIGEIQKIKCSTFVVDLSAQ